MKAQVVATMTPDEKKGIDWWNALSEADRRFWLLGAITSTPAEAWDYFKRCAGDAATGTGGTGDGRL